MIRIGNAPCSWGALEFDLDGKAAGYTQVLDELAETGYVGHGAGRLGLHADRPGPSWPGSSTAAG